MIEPIVSIIVPVYEVEAYLDRCVHSILNQTFDNFEMILVDDGSPDNCPQMCDIWAEKDSRIKVIHKENGGLSSARNAGLDIALGKYINFVDSDDWLESYAIEYLYNLLLKYDADFSMAALTRKVEKPKNKVIMEECIGQKEFIRRLLKIGSQTDVMYAHGKLYRKELFETVRYPIGIIGEDIPTTFHYALFSKKIAVSNQVIYHYFINPKGICASKFGKKTFDYITAAELICKYAKESNADREIQEWTIINRKRINFGVLANLLLSEEFASDCKMYGEQILELRKELHKDLPFLLKAQIPISRKIVMTIMNYSWHPFIPITNFLYVQYKKMNERANKHDT